MPVCEACGEPATRQDCEGVWLCEGDFQHLVEHWLIEEAANG
jgi:ribosomal protein L37AE/L43A